MEAIQSSAAAAATDVMEIIRLSISLNAILIILRRGIRKIITVSGIKNVRRTKNALIIRKILDMKIAEVVVLTEIANFL